jgi:hypothetical protein
VAAPARLACASAVRRSVPLSERARGQVLDTLVRLIERR